MGYLKALVSKVQGRQAREEANEGQKWNITPKPVIKDFERCLLEICGKIFTCFSSAMTPTRLCGRVRSPLLETCLDSAGLRVNQGIPPHFFPAG